MAIAYYGIKLSENVIETPEGYLIFKNAVIGRTGFQIYKGKELPAKELEEQGIVVNSDDDVNVYRSPEEVFSPATIASFNGKPVTDRHPEDMLDIDTVAEHECGQVFNVRRGTEALDDGNYPLLADIIVKDRTLIAKYQSGIRELSCGYTYHIVKSGDNILQVDMIGNHVAFVENGRAGIHVKVNDSKPIQTEKFTMKDFFKKVRKEGLLSLMTNKPEEVAAAFDAMAETEDAEAHVTGCKCSDCMGGKDAKPANDAKAADRDRMHKALDKHLDSLDNAAQEQEANDEEDMNALRAIFTTPSAEKTNASGADSEEEQEEEQEEAEEEEHESEAADEDLSDNASTVIAPADRPKPLGAGTDAAYRAGAEAVLKAFKPFVAKAKNKALTGAFDTTSKLVKGTGWKGSATYGKVARAAATANDEANDSVSEAEKASAILDATYAEARKKKLGIK